MIDAKHPPRLSITNLRNGAEIAAQFNPEEFEESVSPEWSKLKVQGLSHPVHHFETTSAYVCRFTLYFRAFSPLELQQLQRARRHLMSWAYPRRVTSQLVGGGPPSLLVVWPGMLQIETFLTELRIKHERFNSQAQSVEFHADCSFEEHPESLLTSDFVAEDPDQRFGDPFFSE
jgi:hypothetical protein